MAQTTVVPSEFATFAGIVWFAALVTIGIRSTAAALVAGLAFVMLPALAQAYLPTWTANVLPVLFGLGAISAAKYPDGDPGRAEPTAAAPAAARGARQRSPTTTSPRRSRPGWPTPRPVGVAPDGRGSRPRDDHR